MTREDLQQQYAALSTNELLEIIDRKFDYTELAVTVALEEIGRRNLSEENIREYKEEQEAQARSFIKKNIVDDLNAKAEHQLFLFARITSTATGRPSLLIRNKSRQPATAAQARPT